MRNRNRKFPFFGSRSTSPHCKCTKWYFLFFCFLKTTKTENKINNCIGFSTICLSSNKLTSTSKLQPKKQFFGFSKQVRIIGNYYYLIVIIAFINRILNAVFLLWSTNWIGDDCTWLKMAKYLVFFRILFIQSN
jgi:hypothetical protein